MKALLIIDLQNDFTEGGAVAVPGGHLVASAVTKYLRQRRSDYTLVVATRDWHALDSDNGGHIALADRPDFKRTWPKHCLAGSRGADFDPGFDPDLADVTVKKGYDAPGLSAFDGTTEDGQTLDELLHEAGITEIDVVGLAAEFCVTASSAAAVRAGYRTRVISDLTAAADGRHLQDVLSALRDSGIATPESTAA